MSEISKLYENAGIKPIKQGYCDWDSDCPYPDIINDGCGDECPYWKYEDKAKYPPFTAEKQIELVCFLINRGVELSFNCEQGKINTQAIQRGLAGLINSLWQDLTEAEKVQIKEILE